MKTTTFFIALLLCVFTNVNAQNLLENNFNTLDAGMDMLLAPSEYQTTSLTISATVQAADAPGNNGSKFLKLSPGGSNLVFRSPILTLVLGKSYAFTAKTYVPEAKNRVLLFAPATTGAAYKQTAAINTPLAWTDHILTFTPTEAQLSVRAGFYSGQLNTVDLYVDDIMVYEYVDTATPNLETGDTKVVKNLLNGDFRIMSSLLVSAYEVLNANGQLIKTEKGLNSQAVNVSAGDLSKGVYVFKIMTASGKTIIQKIVNN